MKYSKLLAGLALVCGITAANAATIQDATECSLGQQCAFPSDGSIVYFVVPYDENSKKQEFVCKLNNLSETDASPVASVYPGKDAHFKKAKLTVNPLNLSVTLAGSEGVGQIKVSLLKNGDYAPESIGVTCSVPV